MEWYGPPNANTAALLGLSENITKRYVMLSNKMNCLN